MPQLRRGILGIKGESGINPCEGADSFSCLPLFLLKDDDVFKVYRYEYKKRFGWIKVGRFAMTMLHILACLLHANFFTCICNILNGSGVFMVKGGGF